MPYNFEAFVEQEEPEEEINELNEFEAENEELKKKVKALNSKIRKLKSKISDLETRPVETVQTEVVPEEILVMRALGVNLEKLVTLITSEAPDAFLNWLKQEAYSDHEATQAIIKRLKVHKRPAFIIEVVQLVLPFLKSQ